MAKLLLITGEGKKHYAIVKNLNQLLRSSNSQYQHKHYFCLNCLQGFYSKVSRDKHFKYCKDHKAIRIDMLEANSFMRFHSGQYQFKVPFVIYANFEAILQSLEDETKRTMALDPEAPYTKEINHHNPSGFCAYTTFGYRKVANLLRLYWGKDCMEVFCNHLDKEAKRLYNMFPSKPMESLMLEQWREFNGAAQCHICLEASNCGTKGDWPLSLHLELQRHHSPKVQPSVHNSSLHLHHLSQPEWLQCTSVYQRIGEKFNSRSIIVITENREKYISFNISRDLWQGSRILLLEFSILPSFRNANVFLDQVWFKYWNRGMKSFWFKILQF